MKCAREGADLQSPDGQQCLSHTPVFMCLQLKSFENTVGKGEIAQNKQFLLFPQRFLLFLLILQHFHQI